MTTDTTETPLPCPFCERAVTITDDINSKCNRFDCAFCGYNSSWEFSEEEAIAAHNRVAGAAKEVERMRGAISNYFKAKIHCEMRDQVPNRQQFYQDAVAELRAALAPPAQGEESDAHK